MIDSIILSTDSLLLKILVQRCEFHSVPHAKSHTFSVREVILFAPFVDYHAQMYLAISRDSKGIVPITWFLTGVTTPSFLQSLLSGIFVKGDELRLRGVRAIFFPSTLARDTGPGPWLSLFSIVGDSMRARYSSLVWVGSRVRITC